MNSDAESDYTAFVTHHANAMWRTAYLLCGDRRRATQEALLRLYRGWRRIYSKGGILAYASKVVVSTPGARRAAGSAASLRRTAVLRGSCRLRPRRTGRLT
ncbi:hypothetical protein [Kribbella kalugense]|uniref:hypothetical protein n=1 Tax=Kribbella kalugense TaxID=2512221 RepID=UPI001066C6D5|nr:hypothetical protein [Kribbella kalugense]